MRTLQQLLVHLNTCKDARDWVSDKTIEQAVAECPKGEWLLWLANEIGTSRQSLALAAGHCANTVRHLMNDERSMRAVDTAIAFGEGRATEQELSDAAEAAETVDIDALAAWAAAWAAALAAKAAATTWAAARAAWAADMAAAAAADDAYADDPYAAAKKENQKQTADICRKYVGQEIIDKVNQTLKQ